MAGCSLKIPVFPLALTLLEIVVGRLAFSPLSGHSESQRGTPAFEDTFETLRKNMFRIVRRIPPREDSDAQRLEQRVE
jgi:hypothetical protein